MQSKQVVMVQSAAGGGARVGRDLGELQVQPGEGAGAYQTSN